MKFDISIQEESSKEFEKAYDISIESPTEAPKEEDKKIYEILTYNSSPDPEAPYGIVINDDGSCGTPKYTTKLELLGDLLRVTFTDGSIREEVIGLSGKADKGHTHKISELVNDWDFTKILTSSDNSIKIESEGNIEVNTGWNLAQRYLNKLNS